MKGMVCYCKNVTKKEIEEAIQNGAKTLDDIKKATSASTGIQCKDLNPSGKCCSGDILLMLKDSSASDSDECNCCK